MYFQFIGGGNNVEKIFGDSKVYITLLSSRYMTGLAHLLMSLYFLENFHEVQKNFT